jgi:hypothetical protein
MVASCVSRTLGAKQLARAVNTRLGPTGFMVCTKVGVWKRWMSWCGVFIHDDVFRRRWYVMAGRTVVSLEGSTYRSKMPSRVGSTSY